jgi:PAS domain S-box-containing protein
MNVLSESLGIVLSFAPGALGSLSLIDEPHIEQDFVRCNIFVAMHHHKEDRINQTGRSAGAKRRDFWTPGPPAFINKRLIGAVAPDEGFEFAMPAESYSFLDVAVLDGVRERFAAGDALVVLPAALDEIIWANGPGAALFGHGDIESAIGAGLDLSPTARRQIAATSGFPAIGRDRALLVRLAIGAPAMAFLASSLRLPNGEVAILLAAPVSDEAKTLPETAARAIGGFNRHGHHVALLDGEGRILTASAGVVALGLTPAALSRMAADAGAAEARIVKRMLPGRSGEMPAGIARLTDDPARLLLVVIDETPPEEIPDGAMPAEAMPADETAAGPIISEERAGHDAASLADAGTEQDAVAAPDTIEAAAEAAFDEDDSDGWYFQPDDSDALEDAASVPDCHAEIEQSAGGEAWPVEAPSPQPDVGRTDEVVDTASLANAPSPGDASPPEAEPSDPPETRSEAPAAAISQDMPATASAASSVRFIWRTDAAGRFSQISPEFGKAVGERSADILGRSFAEIAAAFGIDPAGEIAGLLQRRDTWSGRTVYWPVAGTDRQIPVDLAALPVYSRARDFEGFRGFGVARGGDASRDPEARGLHLDERLARPSESHDQPAPIDAAPSDGVDEDDPFRGEVPAIAVTPDRERRYSDKVIRLAEHRPSAIEKTLSSGERTAFREIGDRLRKDRDDDRLADDAERPAPAVEDAPAAPEPEVQSPAPSTGEAEATRPARSLFDFSDIGAAEAETPADDIDGRDAQAAGPDDAALSGDEDTPCAEPARSDVSVLEKLPVPVLIHSGDDLHYANGEFLALTGYSSLEALAAAGGIGALFADDYAETDDTPDRQLRLRRPDGETFPVTAFLRSVPWHGGKALLLVLERSKETREPEPAPLKSPSVAEQEARVAEMRTIIDTATDGVVLIAPDGVIRSISRPAEALFGFESDDIAGKPFETLFAMESQKSARDYLAGLSDHGVASVLNDGREVIGREAEGRFIPLFMTIGKLPGDSGYCAVVRDITQWKRAEEELTQARAVAERASSHKTEFLARVSHEIRTPLNAIIGFSELMIDEKFGPVANDRYRDYLRDINRSGNHVLDLVNDLLDISKIEAGQQDMSHEAVALNEALAEAVAIMQPQANRERVIIRSSFASNLPDVVADLRSIRQIALNILSNAIRYTQAGGQVIVSTAYETSGDIALRVRDTGIGMTPAEIEQALKPFKQINALKRPRGDGTGLGLPLTKALVEANRARFEISSTPGKGTLVEIVFPATRVLAG